MFKRVMERYFEIDAVRGIALIGMIMYHTIFCLYAFTDIVPWFNPTIGLPTILSPIGAGIFIGLAGLSLSLAQKTTIQFILRGCMLIGLGLLITFATVIFYSSGPVIFGVLSLIGVGTILAIPFIPQNIKWYIPACFGIVILLLDTIVSNIILPVPYFIPLGFQTYGIYSVDYEPIIPWFGILLLGLALGKLLYPSGKRISFLQPLQKYREKKQFLRPFCFIGRHTLIIYLLHIPIIIIILILTGLIPLSRFFS